MIFVVLAIVSVARCHGNDSSGGGGASTPAPPTSPTPPPGPSLSVSALAPDLAGVITLVIAKWFESVATFSGYPEPSDTSWTVSCPQGGTMQISGFSGTIAASRSQRPSNWPATFSSCGFSSQGQSVTVSGQLSLNGNYVARLVAAFLPWSMTAQGSLTVSAGVGSVSVNVTMSSTTPLTGTIANTSVSVTQLTSVAPFSSATPIGLSILCGVPDLIVPLGASTFCSGPVVYSDGAVSTSPSISWDTSDSSTLSIQPQGNNVGITPRRNGGAVLRGAYQALNGAVGIGTGNGTPPPPDTSPVPPLPPSPTPPSTSCTYTAGCPLGVIFEGSLSSPTDFDLYISSSSTTCKYPKQGSGSNSSLCYGPGCNGDPLRVGSRQFTVLPRFSNATVYLVRAPSSGPSGTGRSVDLTSCSPSSVSFK